MNSNAAGSESAHGRHKTDNFPFSMWLPVELMARIRHLSRQLGVPATQLFRRAIEPLADTVRLDDDDRAWIDARIKQGADRSY